METETSPIDGEVVPDDKASMKSTKGKVNKNVDISQQRENKFARKVFIILTIHYGFILLTTAICVIPSIQESIKKEKIGVIIGAVVSLLLLTPLIHVLYFSHGLRNTIIINYIVYSLFVFPQALVVVALTHIANILYAVIFYATAALASAMVVAMASTRISMSTIRVRYSIIGVDVVFLLIGICIVAIFVYGRGNEQSDWSTKLRECGAIMASIYLGVSLAVGAFLTTNDILSDGDQAVLESDALFPISLFYFTLIALPFYLVRFFYRFFFASKKKTGQKQDGQPSQQSPSDISSVSSNRN